MLPGNHFFVVGDSVLLLTAFNGVYSPSHPPEIAYREGNFLVIKIPGHHPITNPKNPLEVADYIPTKYFLLEVAWLDPVDPYNIGQSHEHFEIQRTIRAREYGRDRNGWHELRETAKRLNKGEGVVIW